MKQRIISALIAILIIVPLIILGGYPYYLGVTIISVIGFYEIIKVREKEKKINKYMKMFALLSFLIIVLSGILSGKDFNIDYRLILMDIFVCLLPLIIFNKKDYDAEDSLVLLAITLFLGLSFKFLITIRNINVLYLVYVLLITITSDTMALFVGSQIGRNKLCPNISPNKTVEGMIGGVVFGTFIGSMFFSTFVSNSTNLLVIIIISLALSLVSEFGDLVFSSIKRRYNVKDYGNIMPGHGGVLDRLDSIIFAILAFSYLVSFF